MASKTAERILLTALTLFNEHGEAAITSVDIAMEMDISPGNLYYHFKGKESIVDALLAMHKHNILPIVAPSSLNALDDEEFIYFFYIILERLLLFRFAYRNAADLAEKYPKAAKHHQWVISQLTSAISTLLNRGAQAGLLKASKDENELLAEMLMMVLIQHCQPIESVKFTLGANGRDEESVKYHAVSQVLTLLLPRFVDSGDKVAQLKKAIQQHDLANLSH